MRKVAKFATLSYTKPDTSRPEALRIAFRDWAIANGYLRHDTANEALRPDQLNASNDG